MKLGHWHKHSVSIVNSVLNEKVQEEALVRAFSMIVKSAQTFV